MAYVPHVLVQLSGDWTFPDMLQESWSCGFRGYIPSGGGHLLDPTGFAASVQAGLATWWGLAAHAIYPQARLKVLKVNNIEPSGKYTDNITHQYVYPTPVAGGSAATQCLAYTTLAWTFETGITIGKARRGRMYPPTAVPPTTGNGVSIASASLSSHTSNAKSFLALFNVVDPGTSNKLRPAVISKEGPFNDITGVSVDTVIDVQRRRKKQALRVRSAVVAFP